MKVRETSTVLSVAMASSGDTTQFVVSRLPAKRTLLWQTCEGHVLGNRLAFDNCCNEQIVEP